MRITIKGADFSNVSIGKVRKDLSFTFESTNPADFVNLFANCDGSVDDSGYLVITDNGTYMSVSPTITDIGVLKIEGTDVTGKTFTNKNRLASDFISVEDDMAITVKGVIDPGTQPFIQFYDADKNAISYIKCANGGGVEVTADIPSDAKYVKFVATSMYVNPSVGVIVKTYYK